jgi:signal transduction histidine kinase
MILLLLVGFAAIQLIGLLIHTVNLMKLERVEQEQDFAIRAVIIYRHLALAPPDQRAALLAKEPLPKGDTVALSDTPPVDSTIPMPGPAREAVRTSIIAYGIPPGIRPHGIVTRATLAPFTLIISFGMPPDLSFALQPPPGSGGPDGGGTPPDLPPAALNSLMQPLTAMLPPSAWLTVTSPIPPPAPWRSPGFATAFLVMTVLGAIMITWAVRQLLLPVKTLAAAAERLGRDVTTAPPLPETGPIEIATAARAFNTMAARIRRFVEDRTFLITAMGHDLRTPITRLKLRAEYMEDDEQRAKMLADLDEMEAMVAATLAFGRDVTATEPPTRLDLASLIRTILDDAADGDPDHADTLAYAGPEHLAIAARPLALKRALTNLVTNALKYGGAARVTLTPPAKSVVRIFVDDDGPGIPAAEMANVFEPFHRLETSRNRETGGSGLGLSIARNILRAHGGDITLTNRESGGLRATITLPL